jgi:hypothetical protein
MRAFDRWRALSRHQKWLTVESAALVALAAAAISIVGLQRLLAMASPGVRGRALDAAAIRERVTAIARAGRYVPGGTCLAQSLALAWMLRRNGVAAAVRIGIRTADGFDAHAWVESDGVALTEGPPRPDGYAVVAESSQ